MYVRTRDIQQSNKDFAEFCRQEKINSDRKRDASLAPLLKESAALHAALRDAKLATRRRELIMNPSADFCARVGTFDEMGRDARWISAAIRLAHDEFQTMMGGRLSEQEIKFLYLFFEANPTADITQTSTSLIALQYLGQELSIPGEIVAPPEAPEAPAEKYQPKKPLTFKEQREQRLAAHAAVKAAEAAERRAVEQNVANEVGPEFLGACATIEESSGLVIKDADRRFLWNLVETGRYGPLTIPNVRKAAASIWGWKLIRPMNDDEKIDAALVEDNNISPEKFKETWGLRTADTRGLVPTGGSPRVE